MLPDSRRLDDLTYGNMGLYCEAVPAVPAVPAAAAATASASASAAAGAEGIESITDDDDEWSSSYTHTRHSSALTTSSVSLAVTSATSPIFAAYLEAKSLVRLPYSQPGKDQCAQSVAFDLRATVGELRKTLAGT